MLPPFRRLTGRATLWVTAVRDSFVVLLPVTFFGVLAVLLRHLPWPGAQQGLVSLFGPGWPAVADHMIQATHGLFSLALAAVLAMRLARRLPADAGAEVLSPHTAGLAAMVNLALCLLVTQPSIGDGFGEGSMLLGMAVGVATAELMHIVLRWRWLNQVQVGYETDPLFFHAARLTLPLIVTGLIVLAAALVWARLPPLAPDLLARAAAWAAAGSHGDWWLNSAAVLLTQLPWALGMHGGYVVDNLGAPLFGGGAAGWASRPLLDSFALLGGSGATLGLLLALLIGTRTGPHRRLAHWSVLPAVFNVNELLIYGLPLALNLNFLLPFVAAPLVAIWLAQLAVASGWMQLLPVSLPWTTPPLLSGWLLSGSWHGAAVQAVVIGLSTAIYLPFVRRAEALRLARQAEAFGRATAEIVADDRRHVSALQRGDQVGLVARGLLADLRADLAAGRLALAYQPKHDAAGRATGVEALLRWPHARHGMVSPCVAVTLAEDGGLIEPLGRWVLDQACATKARWNTQGLAHVSMAVNVSPLQLADPHFAELVLQTLHRHGLQPHDVELEITESQAIPELAVVDRCLQRLSAAGVPLTMDDFGMGHSSLLHLRRFRLQSIKIDGSLTRDVLRDGTSADIIRAIVALARARRVTVVAEFVETAEQRALLRELGCHLFQGYLHSPPLDEAAGLAYLRSHPAPARLRRRALTASIG